MPGNIILKHQSNKGVTLTCYGRYYVCELWSPTIYHLTHYMCTIYTTLHTLHTIFPCMFPMPTAKTNWVRCFNHREVTLVADQLEGWLRGRFPVHLTTTTHWQPWEHPWGNNLLQLWSALVTTPSEMFWGLAVYCVYKMNWTTPLSYLTQLGYHTKIKLS